MMEYSQYIRKPFSVNAVEITVDNIAEVAKLVGELRTDEKNGGHQYIALNRRIVPNVGRAYLGWFMTQLDDNFRCYSPKVFREQFMDFASPVAWTFGDGDIVEEMDREGWNTTIASIHGEGVVDDNGYRQDVLELIGADFPSVDARRQEDIENDADPVNTQTGNS